MQKISFASKDLTILERFISVSSNNTDDNSTTACSTGSSSQKSSSYSSFSCYADSHLFDKYSYVKSEISVWKAVIMQALLDCGTFSKKSSDRIEKERATEWFSVKNKDFVYVCSNADLDPEYVVKKAKNAMKTYCKWRNDVLKERRIKSRKNEKPGTKKEKLKK